MTDETELKLELTMECAAALEAQSLLPGMPSISEQHSIYFDTPDLLLFKSGLSLRIRQSDGMRVQTVKADGAFAAGLFVRTEWQQRVHDDQLVLYETNPINALLHDRMRDISPIFHVYINRQTWIIEQGKARIEIAIDRGEVVAHDRCSAICEIELELKRGSPSALFGWARKIDAVARAHLGILSKAERGYRLRGAIVDSVKAEPVILERDATVEATFQKIARTTLRQFRLNEALIDLRNPHALHQARVGLRRLLSAMTIFKCVQADAQFPIIRDGLRWLTGELGKARNFDVLVSRAEFKPIYEQLEAARIESYSNVAVALRSARTRSLMIDIAEWLIDGRWTLEIETFTDRRQSARSFARHTLSRYRKKVKKAGDLEKLDDAQRHRVRKHSKMLRYASEFFASLFDHKHERHRYKRFIEALTQLQDHLGSLNDLAMAPSVLEQFALTEGLQQLLPTSDSEKSKLLTFAAEARDELLDAKRFWK